MNANTKSADIHAGAFAAWRQLLGDSHVRTNAQSIARYARTTLPSGTTPAGILLPESAEQVQAIAKIAHEQDLKLHTISCGKNWGYGDACATTDGQVIVDLSRMNRIVEVNPHLGYAVVEPGVTQGQMYAHLCDNDIPLILDVTGAGPDAGIVGNSLQRGFGHTPYGNHFAHLCGLEVVLPDGRLIQTGYGAFENAQASRVFPWGLGPVIDGVFTQSKSGIVTQMGFWLLPTPEVINGFAFKVPRETDIEKVVDAMRELRMAGVVRSTVHMANDLRVVSARRRYPWELTGGRTPLPEAIRVQLARDAGIGAWNVVGGLYGTRRQVAAARKAVKRRMTGISHVHFFGASKLRWARRLAGCLSSTKLGGRLVEMVDGAESVYKLLVGNPTDEHLNGVFWRTRPEAASAGADPIHSGCMWLSPVFPLDSHHTRRVLDLVGRVWTDSEFELLVTITAITERAGVAVLSVCYDRTQSGEPDRADACYQKAFHALAQAGYLPYRLGIQSAFSLDAYRSGPPINLSLEI